MNDSKTRPWFAMAWLAAALTTGGCTPLGQFVDNGFQVGPDYQPPAVPLADEWIDARNPQVKDVLTEDYAWWTVFQDPTLDQLVRTAYAQNVSLRVASTRVLQAEAQQAIAVGGLFPQQQTVTGSYARVNTSKNLANSPPVSHFDNWATSFNASWELDFWGKIRRTIETTDSLVDASIEDYDSVMVSLIGDVAAAYVQYRIFQQQLVYTRQNIDYQKETLRIAEIQWKAGETNEFGVIQARSLLAQNESLVPVLELRLRQANNQLCILLGMPPIELTAMLGSAPIPDAPLEVLVGVPADLIRRRPDLRAAERQIAAQSARIGVAEAALYPSFFINGSIGYEAKSLDRLLSPRSVAGNFGPGFQWNILNYGRIVNNIHLQDFATQELVGVYQQKVLSAAREVDNSIATFVNSRRQAELLAKSVQDAQRAVELALINFQAGSIDYTPVFVAQQFLTSQQNDLAQAEGNVAQGLIGVYRGLGGGWELRLHEDCAVGPIVPPGDETEVEEVPTPTPELASSQRGHDPPPTPPEITNFSPEILVLATHDDESAPTTTEMPTHHSLGGSFPSRVRCANRFAFIRSAEDRTAPTAPAVERRNSSKRSSASSLCE